MRTMGKKRIAVVAALSLGMTTALSLGTAAFAADVGSSGEAWPEKVTVILQGGEEREYTSDDLALPSCGEGDPMGLTFAPGEPVLLEMCHNAEVEGVWADLPNEDALHLVVNGRNKIGPVVADQVIPSLEVWNGNLVVYGTTGADQDILEIEAAQGETVIGAPDGTVAVELAGEPSVTVEVLEGNAPDGVYVED